MNFALCLLFLSLSFVSSEDYCSYGNNVTLPISTVAPGSAENTWSSMAILLQNGVLSNTFVVTWQSNMDTSGLGVYGRVYSTDFVGNLAAVTEIFRVNTETLNGIRISID
jgi:hypothetical protein